jgi:hypothetical protein
MYATRIVDERHNMLQALMMTGIECTLQAFGTVKQ